MAGMMDRPYTLEDGAIRLCSWAVKYQTRESFRVGFFVNRPEAEDFAARNNGTLREADVAEYRWADGLRLPPGISAEETIAAGERGYMALFAAAQSAQSVWDAMAAAYAEGVDEA